MRPAPPDMRASMAESKRQRLWLPFLGVLALIVVVSLAGRQLFEMIPLATVWALIAAGCLTSEITRTPDVFPAAPQFRIVRNLHYPDAARAADDQGRSRTNRTVATTQLSEQSESFLNDPHL